MSPNKIEAQIHRDISSFASYLKKRGFRITNQRLLVAETIFRKSSHFTIDDLSTSLRDRKDEISRASIYRIVSLMVEAGLLTEHNFGQDVKYYEHIPSRAHHDHIVCLDCGRIEEFTAPNIEQIQIDVIESHHFSLVEHSLTLYGRCRLLNNQEGCPRRAAKLKQP